MYSTMSSRVHFSGVLFACATSIIFQFRSTTYNRGSEEPHDNSRLTYSSSEQVILSPDFPFSQETGKYLNNFLVVYDKRTRNPKYVVERLYRESVVCSDDEEALAKKKKRKPFFIETSIDSESFRSSPKDYTNVPYDRGHMAPAADFICSPELRDATFTMANICPQAPTMNKGFWAKFEAWLRYQLTHGPYEEMIVITGPVYAPLYVNNEWVFINRTIGTFPKDTADWWPADLNAKAVVSVAAFMVPNTDHVYSKTPLAHTAVQIEQLESILGYKLLPEVVSEKVKQKLDSVVPPARELSQVLDGRAEPSDILFTNGKTTLLLPAAASSSSTTAKDNSNGQIIPNKYAGVTINTQGKKSLVPLSALVSVQHLCEQVDCNKPLFGK